MAEGKKLPIAVVISAVDNVTYKVMSINEKIKRITAPVGKVATAFKTLGDEAGLGKLASQLGKVGSTGRDFAGELSSALTKVAGVGIAAATAIYGVTSSFAHAGDDIDMMSRRLGLTTDQFQELSYAAKLANVDQETFNGAMGKFSKGIAESAAGTGEALVGFNALGISVRDSSGHIRKMDSLLPEVADKLKGIQSQSLRNAIAAKIFGREGAKLNDIFVSGSEGLKEMAAEAHRVGAVMSPDDIKLAAQFDEGFKSIGSTLLMVRNIIGAALAPTVLNLGKTLQTYILDNKDKIKAFASAFAERLPGILDQIWKTLQSVGQALMPVIRLVGWLADTFGTTAVVIAGLVGYFWPLISAFAAFGSALFGTVIPALTTAWKVFSVGWSVISGIVSIMAALVGWPITIAALFVSAALLIWKYWEPISKFFSNIWDKVSGFFGKTTTVNGELTTAPSSAQLGPAMGFGKSVDAAARSSTTKNENEVRVMFDNLPAGTRVEKTKDQGGLDLSMGYGLAGGMP